ncbi:unnamed protein product [Brachionus calyciflorus]|uniref:Ufm1-specific protease 2 n=1 Tax=Brachionus calyciflorus TaxID=104777 RepID=A0A814AC75_9BILA|nr:unnamed protein product [Brachionus calyciflorus]
MADTSRSEQVDRNLPFYLNEFEDLKTFVCLRIRGALNYNNILSADSSQSELLSEQFDKIFNDSQNLNFVIKKINLIISNSRELSGQNFQNCSEIYEKYHNKTLQPDESVQDKLSNYIPIDLFKEVTVQDNPEQRYSPQFINHKGICRIQAFKIPIDCLVLVDPQTKIENLAEIILEKLNQHLQSVKNCYKSYYQNESNFKAETFHFYTNQDFLITCVYPNTFQDDSLVNLRKEIHSSLDLQSDRPILRRVDAFQFSKESNPSDVTQQFSKYLTNPHLSAKPSNVKNGKQSLVKGNYLYFHYMQDNFNDNGWGCAYRSFQTIFSWFRLQNYTTKSIPTHRDIQKALVDMGDKQKEFIGSSKWIGSMEISFCLNQMLNVDCKILSVSKGSELVEKARELQYHFETEGTPVMIGGGVLAHTIVGVDFDELTGDVQFLILDPHYTGGEDIKTITTKGWVAWKDMKFWSENSYYNMCCPIRPKGV